MSPVDSLFRINTMGNKTLPGFVWYHLSEEEELLAQHVHLPASLVIQPHNYRQNF